MRVQVAFTPAEAAEAPMGIVVDVLRATSTIAQALASGYERVYCTGEIDDARGSPGAARRGISRRRAERREDRGLRRRRISARVPRRAAREDGDLLDDERDARDPRDAGALEEVLLGSLLNLDAVAAAARERGEDVAVVCAGFQGQFALDDAYCAGRIVQLLGGEPSDSAKAAEAIARAWPDPHEALLARTYGPPGLEEDIAFSAQVSVLDVVPRLSRMVDGAAEISAVG